MYPHAELTFLGLTQGNWTTVAVALIALAGVALSQWNARYVLRKQLEHDTTQRDLERRMQLRRDVYLEVASAVVRLQTLVGQLANLDLDQNELAVRLAEAQATVAKVHMVGSQPTVEAVMNFIACLGPEFLDLMTRRTPMQIRRANIDTHVALMQQAHAERERFVKMLQEYSLEGISAPARLKAIQDQFDIASKQWDFHNSKRSRLQGKQIRAQFDLADRAVEANKKLVRLLPTANLAIRDEMESKLDPAFYERQWVEQISKMDAAWREAKTRLQSGLEAGASEDDL